MIPQSLKKLMWALALGGFLLVPQLRAAVSPALPPAPPADIARSLGNTFASVAEKVSPAVVVITILRSHDGRDGLEPSPEGQMDPFDFNYRNPRRLPMPPRDDRESQGSGFIVRSDGYIYTNNHVIQGADKIKVKLKDGRSFDAQVVGTPDEKTDVAVIKIDAKNLPTVTLGDSDAIRPGEWTIAIGAPFNLDYSVTVGVLSGKVRDHLGATVYEEYLQTQATINPGNSGGPLLDIDGKVIGINTLIKTRPGVGFYNANVGFAIPIKLAQKVGDLLMTKGKVDRPWLGIDIRTLAEATEVKSMIKGVDKGVLIMAIRPDTPSYASGLKPGDVITAIDGHPVATARDLQQQVLEKKIGQLVKLQVIRDERLATIEIKTGLQPSTRQIATQMTPHSPAPSAPAFGIAVQPLNREIAEQYGLVEKQGLLITDVEEGSSAARCGLQRGMVITEVDGKKVATAQALKEALKKSDPKRGAWLQVSVDGVHTFVILRPEPISRGEIN